MAAFGYFHSERLAGTRNGALSDGGGIKKPQTSRQYIGKNISPGNTRPHDGLGIANVNTKWDELP